MNPERLKQIRLRLDTDDPMFSGMKRLKLKGKDLVHLPMELFHIAEIEVLDLSPERESCLFFNLYEIPGEIGKLINLKVLILDTNEIEELPDKFDTLSRLEAICLSNNYLNSLPPSFSKLQSLKTLHMANNRFEVFPATIHNMKNLEFLDMSDNKLNAIPKDISKLFNLHTLLLFQNNIKVLPETLCGMTTIRTLWIGNNHITKLPARFGQLVNLDWGKAGCHMLSTAIDGNPMKDPPIDICRMGIKAIGKYFEDKTVGQSVSRNVSRGTDKTIKSDSTESMTSQTRFQMRKKFQKT